MHLLRFLLVLVHSVAPLLRERVAVSAKIESVVRSKRELYNGEAPGRSACVARARGNPKNPKYNYPTQVHQKKNLSLSPPRGRRKSESEILHYTPNDTKR